MVGLDCFLNVVRALGMGSCLSVRDRARSALPYSSSAAAAAAAAAAGGRRRKHNGLRRNSSIEELLRLFPGRRILNGGTDAASLFTKQGKKGINQDAMIVWEKFGSKENTIFCGVFDGHGPCGHMVAKRVRDALPLRLSAQLELSGENKDGLSNINCGATGSMNSGEIAFTSFDKESAGHDYEDQDSYSLQTLKESFKKAFKVMDKELKLHPNIDCFYSGTTAVTLVKQGQDLVIGNIGDSRAVLGTKDKNGSFIAVQLTVDLKPNLPKEAQRIRRCKGRIFALQNEPEVPRVWMPNNNSPGLAMARAFGDFCLKDFGLISVPEISYHCVTDKDEFVVLATDGVWDVLSNKEVVDIVASASQSSAAQVLVESAVRGWKLKYPTSKVDDCAVVCLYLSSNSYDSCSSNLSNQ